MHTLRMNKPAYFYKVSVEEAVLQQEAQDMSEVTAYSKHFLALDRAHGSVIYNGWLQWPKSDALTWISNPNFHEMSK